MPGSSFSGGAGADAAGATLGWCHHHCHHHDQPNFLFFLLHAAAEIGAEVGMRVGAEVGAEVGAAVGGHAAAEFGTEFGGHAAADVGTEIGTEVGAEVGAEVGTEVGGHAAAEVGAAEVGAVALYTHRHATRTLHKRSSTRHSGLEAGEWRWSCMWGTWEGTQHGHTRGRICGFRRGSAASSHCSGFRRGSCRCRDGSAVAHLMEEQGEWQRVAWRQAPADVHVGLGDAGKDSPAVCLCISMCVCVSMCACSSYLAVHQHLLVHHHLHVPAHHLHILGGAGLKLLIRLHDDAASLFEGLNSIHRERRAGRGVVDEIQ